MLFFSWVHCSGLATPQGHQEEASGVAVAEETQSTEEVVIYLNSLTTNQRNVRSISMLTCRLRRPPAITTLFPTS